MENKVLLITVDGKISIVDGEQFDFDMESHYSLNAMKWKYRLGMFFLNDNDDNTHNQDLKINKIASNWLCHLRYPDRYYQEEQVYGDVIVYEEDEDMTPEILKNILRFLLKNKEEYHRRMKVSHSENYSLMFTKNDLPKVIENQKSTYEYVMNFLQ